MKSARTRRMLSVFVFLGTLALTLGTALAAGNIVYAKKEIQESNGGWHLMMTLSFGGKPNTAHVPMRFTFEPTAILENYLDDAHGDKPQKRKIPLVGQTPLQESVDVDFSDTRGKLYDKTRFDFTITRSHNFVAGDYKVTVHRADGAQVGTAQTLLLLGDNPVIDRRTISFVGNGKKEKPAAAAPSGGDGAPSENKTAQAGESTETPAGAAPNENTEAPSEQAPDPAAAAKVPPTNHGGCGCRVASTTGTGRRGGALLLAGALLAGARTARRARRAAPRNTPPQEGGSAA